MFRRNCLLENYEGEDLMEFRLVVRGALPPHKRGTLDAKHRIRCEIHPQMRSLWRSHVMLKDQVWQEDETTPVDRVLANKFARCGFRFVPLVNNDSGAMVSLDILIMRRDEPHSVINAAGDIDGRVKTLLDALQMPRQCSELGDGKPSEDEDPFYVLMEDDRLIYELNVTTDTLLVPTEPLEHPRDVVAIVKVKTRVVDGNILNIFGV
jgi:hypothetical protein